MLALRLFLRQFRGFELGHGYLEWVWDVLEFYGKDNRKSSLIIPASLVRTPLRIPLGVAMRFHRSFGSLGFWCFGV